MTTEDVIKKEMIELKENVEIGYDCEQKYLKINLDQSIRIIEYVIEKDIIIIEIIAEDNIDEDYFLSTYQDKIFINQKIYILQYAEEKLHYSEGYITNITKNELTYNSSTNLISSGSPIFLYDSIGVIGIHKEGNNGNIIFSTIQSLNQITLIHIDIRIKITE